MERDQLNPARGATQNDEEQISFIARVNADIQIGLFEKTLQW